MSNNVDASGAGAATDVSTPSGDSGSASSSSTDAKLQDAIRKLRGPCLCAFLWAMGLCLMLVPLSAIRGWAVRAWPREDLWHGWGCIWSVQPCCRPNGCASILGCLFFVGRWRRRRRRQRWWKQRWWGGRSECAKREEVHAPRHSAPFTGWSRSHDGTARAS